MRDLRSQEWLSTQTVRMVKAKLARDVPRYGWRRKPTASVILRYEVINLRAGSDRIERWREHYWSTDVPLEVVPNDSCRDCRGTCYDAHTPSNGGLTVGSLGSLHISEVTAGSVDIYRTRSTIRLSDPDLVKVGVQVRGRGLLIQHDREAVLTPGDFVIYETSHPYSMRFENHFTLLYLMVPRHRLELPSSLATLAAVPVRGNVGLGSLVSSLLFRLRQGLSTASLPVTPLFEDAVLDLVSATLSGHTPPSTSAPGAAISASAKRFIDAHLAEPALDTSMVAAAHHISVRYLQKLFKEEDLTVAGWIRRRRLERCRRDLQDRRRAEDTIGTICARHGLTDSAYFSRLFKRAYGISPRAFREQSQKLGPA